jgi:16S rRNA C1402 N4-methylase RsmH
MTRLTEVAHAAVRPVLAPGDCAIDATAGNGHDTRFLSERVGPSGRVFGFDVQPEALVRTTAALGQVGNVTLLQRDHAEMRDAIPQEFHGRVAAVMFNLGYLPGGDHAITTRATSTLTARSAALELLQPGGVLTVLAYTGHSGGSEEAKVVANLLSELPAAFQVREERSEKDGPAAPRLFVVHKLNATG